MTAEVRDEEVEIRAPVAEPIDAPLLFALRPVRALAIVACASALVAGALVPALHGWIVGISNFIDHADLVAEALSQAFALFLVFAAAALLLQLIKSRAPIALRAVGMLLGSLATFAVLSSVGVARMPMLLHVVVCLCASATALVFGADATLRGGYAGLVPVAVGLASLLRGVGAYLAEVAADDRRDLERIRTSFETAQLLATVAAALAVLAAGCGLVWLVRRERRRGIAAILSVLAVSLLLAQRAAAPIDDLESAWSVLLRRVTQHLGTRPAPVMPSFFVALCAVLPVVAAFALATLPRRGRVFAAGMALALATGVSAEVPVLGLGLVIGALAMSIDRRDPQGVQAALEKW